MTMQKRRNTNKKAQMEKAQEEEKMRKNLQKLERQREHYTQQAQILADQK